MHRVGGIGDRSWSAANSIGVKGTQDYEVWLKMAADNKINAKNSWNFALIDYFYDLSQQPIVNFPRASAILDGCIKIYSSRVDSVATETGTLLSGLASHKELMTAETLLEESEEVSVKSYRRRTVRLESTLVKDFSEIKVKAIEKELHVDPMFRKTLSYFDEGGAKSLLLNNLNIDEAGRVIFDTQQSDPIEISGSQDIPESSWDTLRLKFFLAGEQTEYLLVCESMPALKLLLQNPEGYKQDISPSQNINEEIHDDLYEFEDGSEENNDFDLELFTEKPEQKRHEFQLSEFPDYELMDYFDDKLKQTYTRSDYWKVDNMMKKFTTKRESKDHKKPKTEPTPFVPFAQKDGHIIDFLTEYTAEEEMAFEDEIFSESVAKISIPVVHRKMGKRYNNFCLPEDLRFSSRRLIQLFSKPQKLLNSFNKRVVKENLDVNETLENYMPPIDEPSRLLDEVTREDLADLNDTCIEDFGLPMNYDNDFDEKHNSNENIFNDLANNGIINSANLHTKLNYEKIAKRFDIKLIKKTMMENIHNEISFNKLIESIPHELNGSTSIYFICLLHLCNEFNLTLHTTDNDLLVYKDL